MKKILACVLAVIIALSAMFMTVCATTYDYVYVSGDTYPESEHNYQDDMFCTWEYTYSGEAEGIFVTFSEETSLNGENHVVETEHGNAVYYDYIYLSYQRDETWEYLYNDYRGKDLAGRTVYFPSNTIRITLSTDLTGSDYGFSIDRISDEPPENETIIRYHCYSPDKVDWYSCHGDGEAEVAQLDEIRNPGFVFAGWSTEPDGETTEHVAYDALEAGMVHDLYAVWRKPIIEFQDSFCFLNGDVGYSYPADNNYYMTDDHYNMMIKNLFKNFGIGPIPAPIIAAVLSTYPSWEFRGSCYGIAAFTFLQYHGVIDFLEGTNAKSLSGVRLNGEVISRINYYQAQAASSFLCENLAPQSGTPVYSEQIKNMFETVESGKPVLFSYYDYGKPYLLSIGHTVVLTDAFSDVNGNHYLVACDSNYFYPTGECHYYRISSDFSTIYDCNRRLDATSVSRIGGFNWTADYKQFTSFDINGGGNPAVWYNVLFTHIVFWVKTVFSSFLRF